MVIVPYSISLLPMTLCRTGILINAINNVAAALIPPESEKTSINSPRRKLKIKIDTSSFLIGYRKMKKI